MNSTLPIIMADDGHEISKTDVALARIEQDLKALRQSVKRLGDNMASKASIEEINNRIDRVERDVKECITSKEYEPVRRVLFAVLVAILLAVVGSVMALVLR